MKSKKRGAFGERHGMARLTEDQVLEIRTRCRQGVSRVDLGAVFGVSPANISMINRRKIWAHIAERTA